MEKTINPSFFETKELYEDKVLIDEINKDPDVWEIYLTFYCKFCKRNVLMYKPCRKISPEGRKYLKGFCKYCKHFLFLSLRSDFPYDDDTDTTPSILNNLTKVPEGFK